METIDYCVAGVCGLLGGMLLVGPGAADCLLITSASAGTIIGVGAFTLATKGGS